MPPLAHPRPPLTDGEILLRPWTRADAPALVAMLNEPEIARWTRVPSPYRESDARSWLATHERLLRSGEQVPTAIADAGGGRPIGSIDLRVKSWDERRAEFGFLVAREARGRGVAPRALRLMSEWAMRDLGMRRLEVLVQPGNAASLAAVARAGYTREDGLRSRTIDGARVELVMHSLLAEEP